VSVHKQWSLLKSGARFVGCLAPAFGLPLGLSWFAGWFALAELLGIFEEIEEP